MVERLSLPVAMVHLLVVALKMAGGFGCLFIATELVLAGVISEATFPDKSAFPVACALGAGMYLLWESVRGWKRVHRLVMREH